MKHEPASFFVGSGRNSGSRQTGRCARPAGPHCPFAIARCSLRPPRRQARSALAAVGSKVRITNLKTFGVTIPGAPPDRPYVFVKLETNEGLVGWGEGTLEGKAGAVMACINDFRSSCSAPIRWRWSTTGNRCTSTAFTAPAR